MIDVALTVEGARHIREHPGDAELLASVAKSFRAFLDLWHFIDQDTGEDKILGRVLWPAQEEFIAAAELHPWLFALKARQLGETTLECAYDAWVARFRGGARNARVHLFSKREKEAQGLLERVKYGLERLPEWMRLPAEKDNNNEYWVDGGKDDTRKLFAYPADNDTARGETCTHAHVDEWAFMGNPARVWQAIEPSAAGTLHILTTGQGPANWTSGFWRRCVAGDAKSRAGDPIHPLFIGALARPDRTDAWLRAKKKGMDEDTFKQEYPMKWEDALSGGGDYVFKSHDIDECGVDFRPMGPAAPGRKYVKAWDIGRHKDAAVGLVLDVTDERHDVVFYGRYRELRYPDLQAEIERVHRRYPGTTWVESNAAGEAVLENLDIPEHQREGFSTNGSSKPRILSNLKIATQNQLIAWDPVEAAQLDAEMRGYQLPDDHVVQDSVIALAIAESCAGEAHIKTGRVLSVLEV